MIEKYEPQKIEQKWQKIWDEKKTYHVNNHEPGKENEYVLIEFPYPSGIGLHMGHCRSYTAIDAYARKERLCGKNVLFPFGTDAFGLEAERTAIKEHKLPQEIVARNIQTFHSQVKGLGLSIDWSRSINSCDEDYYKWTQWQFIQFFKKGLAEKQETTVNWCPNCGVLANEEVEDGKCCQCHSETTQKAKAQWVLKMTEYGERLADDLKIAPREARALIANFYQKHEDVKKFMDNAIAVAKETGKATTMFGRTRKMFDINASNFMVRSRAERASQNMPLQGTAADIIKIAMVNTFKTLKENNLKAKLIMQVHDELIVDAPLDEKDKVIEILRNEMENAAKLKVPLVAQIESSYRWSDGH